MAWALIGGGVGYFAGHLSVQAGIVDTLWGLDASFWADGLPGALAGLFGGGAAGAAPKMHDVGSKVRGSPEVGRSSPSGSYEFGDALGDDGLGGDGLGGDGGFSDDVADSPSGSYEFGDALGDDGLGGDGLGGDGGFSDDVADSPSDTSKLDEEIQDLLDSVLGESYDSAKDRFMDVQHGGDWLGDSNGRGERK